MMKRIVWMSVASVAFIVAATLYAFAGGHTDGVIAAGSAAVATAILATREK
jgi:hypothetical protein